MYSAIIYSGNYGTNNEYNYNVHILYNGFYAGIGRYCKTITECNIYLDFLNISEDMRIFE